MLKQSNAAEVFHPGVFIREELVARGWSQVELARRTGLPGGTVRPVVCGYVEINSHVAERLAAVFGTSATFWLNLNMQYYGERLRKACVQCGVAIQAQRSTRRYCSIRCQRRARKQRRKDVKAHGIHAGEPAGPAPAQSHV